jgi:hypothetical protein
MRYIQILLEYKTPVDAVNVLLALWRRAKSANSFEQESSRKLYQHTLNKIGKEYGEKTAREMDQYIQSGQADEDDSKLKPAKYKGGEVIVPKQTLTWPPRTIYTRTTTSSRPKPQPKPQPKPNTGTTGAKSGNWEFIRVLRFTDASAGKRGSDKIWGYAKNASTGEYIAFWGGYGKTVQTLHKPHPDLLKAAKSKMAKGYRPIDINDPTYRYLHHQAKTWS